jgi:hypothetical protein
LEGLLKAATNLSTDYKGKNRVATVDADGRIEFDGQIFNSPSLAANAITHRPTNGWWFWKYQDKDGNWVRLDNLRK